MTASSLAMDKLTSQWYNAIVSGCGFNPDNFQLVQGNTTVQGTSEELWKLFDAIPPLTTAQYYDPNAYNSFANTYGGVINNLIPDSDEFRQAMGDYYAAWSDYKKTAVIPDTATDIVQAYIVIFEKWAYGNMPEDKAQNCISLYIQLSHKPIPTAVAMWHAMVNAATYGNIKAYNTTIEQLKSALLRAPGMSILMDSHTASDDISHTWAHSLKSSPYWFFWMAAGAQHEKLTRTITEAGLKIEAKYQHLVTIPVYPLNQPSSDDILKKYKPWYNSEALNIAYHHLDNTVWQHEPPTWEDTFGPNGNLKRVTTALAVVDGIDITMTSSAFIEQNDHEYFKSAISSGFWPFYARKGTGGWNHDFNFIDQGGISITSHSPAGNPNILGVIVTPIEKFFG